jgi:hypothetical protein
MMPEPSGLNDTDEDGAELALQHSQVAARVGAPQSRSIVSGPLMIRELWQLNSVELIQSIWLYRRCYSWSPSG